MNELRDIDSTLSKRVGKNQESIQSSTTPDPGYQWESDNFKIRHHKREPRGQPFPAGDHKALINRHARKHNKKDRNNTNNPQKKHSARMVSKNIPLEGPNWPHSVPTPPQPRRRSRHTDAACYTVIYFDRNSPRN